MSFFSESSFFEKLKTNFLSPWIWHYFWEDKYFRWLFATRKYKKFGPTSLSQYLHKNSRSNYALCKQLSSFSTFRILLTVVWLYLARITSEMKFNIETRTLAKNKKGIPASHMNNFVVTSCNNFMLFLLNSLILILQMR